jgi:DNA-binding NarL/FixJ family response regulator
MTDRLPCDIEREAGNAAYAARHVTEAQHRAATLGHRVAEVAGTVAEDARTRPRDTHMTAVKKIDQLRELAAAGKSCDEIAYILGWKRSTVRAYASACRVRLHRKTVGSNTNSKWDWAAEMPRLRANVRAEVAAIMAGIAP